MPLEATISNMWEIAVIVEVLERKGLRTKQDLYDVITEFRRKNSLASIPETVSLRHTCSPKPRTRLPTTSWNHSIRTG
jgi:hypothetical protein